jgi:hypothetical protein
LRFRISESLYAIAGKNPKASIIFLLLEESRGSFEHQTLGVRCSAATITYIANQSIKVPRPVFLTSWTRGGGIRDGGDPSFNMVAA